MSKKSNSKSSTIKLNVYPLAIKVPAEPPAIKAKSPCTRRLRFYGSHTEFLELDIYTLFKVPSTTFNIQTVKVWAAATSTTAFATVSLTEFSTNRVFTDTGALGRPMACVGFQFPWAIRQIVLTSTGTRSMFTYNGTSPAAFDIVVTYLA
jgi:hypothetical protein